ncbi:hypothetical protein PV382_23355 [Streptomyces scabiei]|uniref:hypothetical protein n=1 Tax=Streptomyces scabiei TaxID=1930 RepID=UPI0029B76092|nr:hypothetical protein [Streptomyces scabiei]MDX3175190.1 hypothetical protein [Streptomyces scabiei]
MYNSLALEVARLRRDVAQVKKGQRLAHGASIEDSALEVRDDSGSLRAIVGQQGDGTTAVTIVNGPPPPQPTDPVVASVLGGVTASWTGTFAGGAVLPLDWQRVEVHASTASTYDPTAATLQATIETAQGGTVVVPCDDPVYVRLVARNTSGTAGTPSGTVGPFGPTPVVADDILDGIVTELKLADEAVTEAKIAANAVTDVKIIAGAILAGHIAAGAVVTDKLAAEAVTAAKIAALAITTDKLAANAVTTGKLAAGSVDATAIAADAITGKTISGGTITGTTMTGGLIQTASSGQRITLNEAGANKVIVYNSSGVAIGELSAQGLLVKGSTGAVLWLNPNATYPQLNLYNAANTSKATIQVTEPTTGDANLETFCGPFTGSGHSDMTWRSYLARDAATIERVRAAADGTVIGGRLALFNDEANIGFKNTADPTQDTNLFIEANLGIFSGGRLQVVAPASSNSALYVEVPSGHTGNMLRLFRDAIDRFKVDKDGNATVSGILTAGSAVTGTVSITPSAAHTPTSALVTYPAVAGSTFRGYATAQTTVPGVRTPAGAAGVTGVSVSSVTSTSMLVWVNRENTTATTIHWEVNGS